MTPEVVVAVIVALSGGGGVVAAYRAWQDHRKGVRESDAQETTTAIDGFRSLVESLRSEVDRLKQDREQDRARIDRIEHQITVERDLKWLAIQHIRALHAWIAHHLPGVAPPAPPDALADHIIYPTSPPTAPEETP